ncbi:hypothetical protein R3P38DRAFT_3600787 [Favolaschia claudopus]|uniref:Uncharacterized protein n=1 Tax=Favolaschia claudopus TaxID=2862362 RepID=A0AAW0ACG4_9AGAR
MPSSVSISSLAALENPRAIPSTKFILFDAQIYLGSSEPAFVGSLRYFNEDNLEFEKVACYVTYVIVFYFFSDKLAPVDYHAFGDIIYLVSLGFPENINPKHHAIVHICGSPSAVDKDNSTFDLTAEQYLSANKAYDNRFPVHCVFPDTARWKK